MDILHYSTSTVQGQVPLAAQQPYLTVFSHVFAPLAVELQPGDLIMASASEEFTYEGAPGQNPTDLVYLSTQIDVSSDPTGALPYGPTPVLATIGGTGGHNVSPLEHHTTANQAGAMVWTLPAGTYYFDYDVDVIESTYPGAPAVKIDPWGTMDITVFRAGSGDTITNIPSPTLNQVGNVNGTIFAQDGSGAVTITPPGGSPVTLGNPGASWEVKGAALDSDGKADLLMQTGYGTSIGNVWEWEVDLGTHQISATHMLGTPGSDWHLVGEAAIGPTGAAAILQSVSTGEVWEWQLQNGAIVSSAAIGNPGADWVAQGFSSAAPGRLEFMSGNTPWHWDLGTSGAIATSAGGQ